MNILEYETTQELKSHGAADFPFTIYLCSIPLDFSIVPTHWHNDMELIYIKKGIGKITVDLEPFFVSQGDIIIVPPGQLHSIEQYDTNIVEYENIIFQLNMLMATQGDFCTETFFQPLLQRQITLPNHYTPNNPVYPMLSTCLNTIDELCKSFSPGYEFALKGQLFSFFYALFSSIQSSMPRHQNKSLDRLKDILKYVETNYSDKISIADAAAICGFSQSHFMKFFKTNMAVSFTDYLNDYRLTMAARLLLSSTDAIVNIAVEMGFDNLSYFNRLFKRKYLCTPTQFRNKS
ncbi:MAG: AraC family transcriptional regulator [Lachnospiraceae bacterium]